MTIGPVPLCVKCKYYDRSEDAEIVGCKAFPKGIPDVILLTGFVHTSPYPGDNGIMFEPV